MSTEQTANITIALAFQCGKNAQIFICVYKF